MTKRMIMNKEIVVRPMGNKKTNNKNNINWLLLVDWNKIRSKIKNKKRYYRLK